VVTSCSPLLWLVNDTTSEACTHARRSNNRKKIPQRNSLCSFVRRECTVLLNLCFCWHYTGDILEQLCTSIRVFWRIWCKALSWWAQYESDAPIAKSQKRISSWKAGYKTHVRLQMKILLVKMLIWNRRALHWFNFQRIILQLLSTLKIRLIFICM